MLELKGRTLGGWMLIGNQHLASSVERMELDVNNASDG
jgi:hypothetical protein